MSKKSGHRSERLSRAAKHETQQRTMAGAHCSPPNVTLRALRLFPGASAGDMVSTAFLNCTGQFRAHAHLHLFDDLLYETVQARC